MIDFTCAADVQSDRLEYRPERDLANLELLKRQWFTRLVGVGMAEAAIQLIVGRNDHLAPNVSLWIGVPLVVV